MQTRKRAKSVTFGKKHKEKEEPKKVEEEVVAAEAEKEPSVSSEQATHTEGKETKGKEPQFELSETLPKNEPEEEKEEAKEEEKEEEKSDVETPASEFVSDGALSATPELPKNSKEEATATPEEHTAAPVEPVELSQPVEPDATTPATEPTGQQAEDAQSGLPPSAFTIQSNEAPAPAAAAPSPAPEGGKKRFGLYFFVVAFTAFILGLGAMAAASYFGLFNGNLSKLPAGVQVPGILGQKPTPTTPPPTVKPTEKPVDLTAFTISVLNGSGIVGKAADEKTALTTAGFKVTSTGNASTSDFTKTKITAKKSVSPAFIKKLEDELGKSFTVDTIVGTSPDSDPSDVTVTLGVQTAQ